MNKNSTLKKIIRTAFIKGNLFGLIEKGFPEDEYVLEEGKLYTYIENNQNSTELDIYNELVKIIEDWFGNSPLHKETLKKIRRMSNEIYEKINNL